MYRKTCIFEKRTFYRYRNFNFRIWTCILLLSELLIKLGKKLGLDEQDAISLSTSTFIGSARLLEMSSYSVEELRKNVTSPGGTTEAALEILLNKKNGLEIILQNALNAAIIRAEKLNIK